MNPFHMATRPNGIKSLDWFHLSLQMKGQISLADKHRCSCGLSILRGGSDAPQTQTVRGVQHTLEGRAALTWILQRLLLRSEAVPSLSEGQTMDMRARNQLRVVQRELRAGSGLGSGAALGAPNCLPPSRPRNRRGILTAAAETTARTALRPEQLLEAGPVLDVFC